MITKYLALYIINKIEKVQIIRETEKSVFVSNKFDENDSKVYKEAKFSTSQSYHDSWWGARKALLDRANQNVKSAKHQLDAANRKLKRIEQMQPF